MESWAIGFACTLAIETPVYVLGLRRLMGIWRAVGVALALNLLTHPAAWWLTRRWSWSRFAAVEVGVWLVEAAALTALVGARRGPTAAQPVDRRAWPWLFPWVLAFTANALSAGVGLLL